MYNEKNTRTCTCDAHINHIVQKMWWSKMYTSVYNEQRHKFYHWVCECTEETISNIHPSDNFFFRTTAIIWIEKIPNLSKHIYKIKPWTWTSVALKKWNIGSQPNRKVAMWKNWCTSFLLVKHACSIPMVHSCHERLYTNMQHCIGLQSSYVQCILQERIIWKTCTSLRTKSLGHNRISFPKQINLNNILKKIHPNHTVHHHYRHASRYEVMCSTCR